MNQRGFVARATVAGALGGAIAAVAMAVLGAAFLVRLMPKLMPRMMARMMADAGCAERMRTGMETFGCAPAGEERPG